MISPFAMQLFVVSKRILFETTFRLPLDTECY
jgi:hypothetical protein